MSDMSSLSRGLGVRGSGMGLGDGVSGTGVLGGLYRKLVHLRWLVLVYGDGLCPTCLV